MCGLVGFLSFKRGFPIDKRRFMQTGLLANLLRGSDSTGIALVDKDLKSVELYKEAIPSYNFIQQKAALRMLENQDDVVVAMGHTRAKTTGAVKTINAHPFRQGPITLMHNGFISNYRTLAKYGDFESEVDSEWIAYALSKNDPLKVLEKLDGAFALAWHNSDTQAFHIAHNGGRPLAWAFVDEWDGLAFASEQEDLAWSLSKATVDVSAFDKEEPQFWEPKENTLYSWNLKEKDVRRYVESPFTKAVEPTRTRSHGQRSSGDGLAAIGHLTTAEMRHTPTDSEVQAKIFEHRAILTKAANKWRPVTDRQKIKAKHRLSGLGIVAGTTYGCTPKLWLPYTANSDNGLMVGKFSMNVRGAEVRTLIHNMPKKYWDGIKSFKLAVNAVTCYVLGTLGNFVVCEPHKGRELASVADYTLMGRILAHEKPASEKDEDIAEQSAQLVMVPGENGFITEEEWFIATDAGCMICEEPPDINHAEKMVWLDGKPVCHYCVANPDNHGFIERKVNSGRVSH